MKNKVIFGTVVVLIIGIFVADAIVDSKNKKNLLPNPKVEIIVKNYGSINLELDRDNAPLTVENFLNLVEDKFYDNLTFHRIIKGFMIQGGSPNGNSSGGLAKTIKGEFKANNVNNKLSHVRGTISMARAEDYNSASSQFFIMHKDNTSLDGQYAAFGKVISGMEVVDKIAENTKAEDDNGTVLSKNQPIIESIRIIE